MIVGSVDVMIIALGRIVISVDLVPATLDVVACSVEVVVVGGRVAESKESAECDSSHVQDSMDIVIENRYCSIL